MVAEGVEMRIKITITVQGVEVTLSKDEARKLWLELDDFFGKSRVQIARPDHVHISTVNARPLEECNNR